jgi:hypothetical protein
VKLLVPVMPPVNVFEWLTPTWSSVNWMVMVPVWPVASTIGLAKDRLLLSVVNAVTAPVPPFTPSVRVPVPRLESALPNWSVPCRTSTPPEKALPMLEPARRDNIDVALS